jgi:hypothetical protein
LASLVNIGPVCCEAGRRPQGLGRANGAQEAALEGNRKYRSIR